jgi:hypothetical protein
VVVGGGEGGGGGEQPAEPRPVVMSLPASPSTCQPMTSSLNTSSR